MPRKVTATLETTTTVVRSASPAALVGSAPVAQNPTALTTAPIVYHVLRLSRERRPHVSGRRRPLAHVSPRGAGHARGLRARSAPGVGMVRLAPRLDRGGAAESGSSGAGRAGGALRDVHLGDAERGRAPRPGGQQESHPAPWRHLDAPLLELRRRAAGSAGAIARAAAAVRLRRLAAAGRGVVRRVA